MPDPDAFDHLKMCRCSPTPTAGYECARCDRIYCLTCDHASDVKTIKTIVRYCPDWRCQRERRIEEGELVVSAADIERRLRDAFLAGLNYGESGDVGGHDDGQPGGYERACNRGADEYVKRAVSSR